MWCAGIDLAGKEENPTYICFYSFKEKSFVIKKVYTNPQIIECLKMFKPRIIAIDAPLSLPNKGKTFRKGEKELISLGYRPMSLSLPSMRLLYDRAKKLLPSLLKFGEVIEVFSTACMSSLKITKEYAERIFDKKMNKDEIDAFACCMATIYYHKGNYKELGDKEEGIIILPVLYD